MDSIKKYWRIYLAGLMVLGGGFYLATSSSAVNSIQEQEQSLLLEIEDLEAELAQKNLTEEDLEPEVEIIEQAGAHARDMGAEMIATQKKLAGAYRTDQPVVDYEDQSGLDEAEETYTRLTQSTDYVNTWFLNSEWDMELDSVGTYVESQNIPVVFSMYTKDGDLAGVVRAKYNSERDLLDDIVIDYTIIGYADEVDVGGL